MVELGEWEMIMRGPGGDEYPIASGQLPASILPDPADGAKWVMTVELAQFIRGIGDQIEELAVAGQIPDMMWSIEADDIYSRPQDPPGR